MLVKPLVRSIVRSFAGAPTGSGVSGFSPKALFAGGVAGAWYDPSDFSTLYQDIAGTIPVTAAGQTVGKMLDKSGNGLHMLAPSDPLRPTLQIVNGGYALVGAAAEYMSRTGGGNYSVFTLVGAVSKYAATGINGWFADRLTATGGFGAGTSSSEIYAQVYNGAAYVNINSATTLTLQANVPYVQSVAYNGSVASTSVNGSTEATLTTAYTVDANAQFNVMGNANIGYWNGAFFGCVYINKILSTGEKANITRYYIQKANVRPLIAVGDSFTYNTDYGQTMPDFYPDRLDVLLGASAYQVQNLGISGHTSAQMVARITALNHGKSLGNGIAIIYCGGNDTNSTFQVQAAPAPTTTVFAVNAGLGSRFGAGAYITVNGVQAIVQSVATDTITLTTPLGFTPTAGQTVTIDTQANIIKLAQTINCPRTIVVGQHFLNFTTGGESTSGSTGSLETLRAKQLAAANAVGAVYVDMYDWMRDLIVAGTYTLGNDLAWHVAVSNTHLNNTGEQIIADAIYSAMQARGWA